MNNFQQLKTCIAEMRFPSYLDIELSDCTFWVNPRPTYCDRGRYQWGCESKDQRVMTVDSADRFPRYFFGLDEMISEMQAWCDIRKQEIILIRKEVGGVPD